MEQRLSMITLIVDDIEEARSFFEKGLGWAVNAAPSPAVVFFQVPGSVFALYDRKALINEIGQEVVDARKGAVTICWNGRNEQDVDAAFDKAVAAGAKPIKNPEASFWGGYSSYVSIPGGHLLELAYNPFWEITQQGFTVLPEPQ